ncbi:MAG: tRNA (guanosine(46)-N7)-methyltransferase TrmB [Candidatus Izemoplasmatales bacterium]
MRLRRIPRAEQVILDHPEWVIPEPKSMQGKWQEVFGNNNKIQLEVGCGKGQFLMKLAKANPDCNYIGIEKFDSVILRALEKLLDEPLSNLRLIWADAEDIDLFFQKGEIDQVYLNFSDPWPKNRQAKRRLSHPNFLARYARFLQSGQHIALKTDNFGLFSYSMLSFTASPDFRVLELDLQRQNNPDNVTTEFEDKFIAMGNSIFYLDVDRLELST